jgi:exodeoxyribonuclease-3
VKLATFNANSVRVRLPIVLGWLHKEAPDVLCLQETKVQDGDFPAGEFRAAGYDCVFRGQKAYNGVAIISRVQASSVRRHLLGGEEEQARFLSAVIADVPVINAYVPQGYSPDTDKFAYKLKWLDNLLAHLEDAYDPDTPLVVTGDFNVALEPADVYDPKGLEGQVGFHPEERSRLRKLLDWGLTDVFRKHRAEAGQYTFWDYRIPNGLKRNMGWRIDYILATRPVAARSTRAWIDKDPRGMEKPSDHTFLVAEFA